MREFTAEAAAEAKARWFALADQDMDAATLDMWTLAGDNATDTGMHEGFERRSPEWYVMWADTFNMLLEERAAEEREQEQEAAAESEVSVAKGCVNYCIVRRVEHPDSADLILQEGGKVLDTVTGIPAEYVTIAGRTSRVMEARAAQTMVAARYGDLWSVVWTYGFWQVVPSLRATMGRVSC